MPAGRALHRIRIAGLRNQVIAVRRKVRLRRDRNVRYLVIRQHLIGLPLDFGRRRRSLLRPRHPGRLRQGHRRVQKKSKPQQSKNRRNAGNRPGRIRSQIADHGCIPQA